VSRHRCDDPLDVKIKRPPPIQASSGPDSTLEVMNWCYDAWLEVHKTLIFRMCESNLDFTCHV
jgi:hypothetical protein